MEQYFEWYEDKNRKNQKKHDISFETASLVFEDQLRISIQDRHTNGEE
ncbi:BrnT family toxin, partial [Acinetobacter baumannii]